jgi:hypothetical protein
MGIEGVMRERKSKKASVDTSSSDDDDEVEQKVILVSKTPDERAHEAAKFLSNLRKRRFELATGEIDAVFSSNEGLRVALDEIKRIEQQYMALFLGKTTRQTSTHYFDVVPTAVMDMYPVCKFSDDKGVLKADSSGRSIMLELHAEDKYLGQKSATARNDFTFKYRTPEVANLRILDGKEELYSGRFYVYQLGRVENLGINVVVKNR